MTIISGQYLQVILSRSILMHFFLLTRIPHFQALGEGVDDLLKKPKTGNGLVGGFCPTIFVTLSALPALISFRETTTCS
jgi:hypothetical protein